jgi:hypothetical protein
MVHSSQRSAFADRRERDLRNARARFSESTARPCACLGGTGRSVHDANVRLLGDARGLRRAPDVRLANCIRCRRPSGRQQVDHVIKAMRGAGLARAEIEEFCDDAMSGEDRELLRTCSRWVTLVPH